jgi:hypothetical protein
MKLTAEMRREMSRVSFLMCPFCVRVPSSELATYAVAAFALLPWSCGDRGAAGFAGGGE